MEEAGITSPAGTGRNTDRYSNIVFIHGRQQEGRALWSLWLSHGITSGKFLDINRFGFLWVSGCGWMQERTADYGEPLNIYMRFMGFLEKEREKVTGIHMQEWQKSWFHMSGRIITRISSWCAFWDFILLTAPGDIRIPAFAADIQVWDSGWIKELVGAKCQHV